MIKTVNTLAPASSKYAGFKSTNNFLISSRNLKSAFWKNGRKQGITTMSNAGHSPNGIHRDRTPPMTVTTANPVIHVMLNDGVINDDSLMECFNTVSRSTPQLQQIHVMMIHASIVTSIVYFFVAVTIIDSPARLNISLSKKRTNGTIPLKTFISPLPSIFLRNSFPKIIQPGIPAKLKYCLCLTRSPCEFSNCAILFTVYRR